jgi:hypothetical protein
MFSWVKPYLKILLSAVGGKKTAYNKPECTVLVEIVFALFDDVFGV